mgnify:CR=1 FL=1
MVSYDDTMRYLPLVMRRLRLRAGHKTQTSALRAIRRQTGVGITAARICEWESGRTAPSLRSLFAFLLGLGYDLKVLQDEVEQLAEAGVAAPPPPVKENRGQRGARRLAEIQASKRYLEEFGRRYGAEE